MKRLHGRSTDRRRRWVALCLALFMLLQVAPLRALAATGDGEGDAPPSKANANDALVESLLDFFFGPQQQAASATQAKPLPTPAQAGGQAQPSPTPSTNAPAGAKGEAKPLQYP